MANKVNPRESIHSGKNHPDIKEQFIEQKKKKL